MKYHNFLVIIALMPLFSCHTDPSYLPEENGQFKLTSTQLLQDETYKQKIEDFYDGGTEGTFKGKEGVQIYYRIFQQEPAAKDAIMISAGRTEAAIKYKELIYDLCNNGYAVFIHDHRGQGLSGRMTEDPEMGYIDSFQFYIDDMKFFYEGFMKPGTFEKHYLLAHSMGGTIGMSYLEQYPDDFSAAAFSSPMLGLKAPTCALVGILAGKEPKYGLGEGRYNNDKLPFEENHVTGSEIRFKRGIAAFGEIPKARLGGASYQWVHRSCQHIRLLFENIEQLKTPFILFSAQNEVVVNPKSHQKFVEKARKLNKECEVYVVPDAQHEILMEKDEQRRKVINASLKFFAVH